MSGIKLTPPEVQTVLRLRASGLNIRVIAAYVGVSERTIGRLLATQRKMQEQEAELRDTTL